MTDSYFYYTISGKNQGKNLKNQPQKKQAPYQWQKPKAQGLFSSEFLPEAV